MMRIKINNKGEIYLKSFYIGEKDLNNLKLAANCLKMSLDYPDMAPKIGDEELGNFAQDLDPKVLEAFSNYLYNIGLEGHFSKPENYELNMDGEAIDYAIKLLSYQRQVFLDEIRELEAGASGPDAMDLDLITKEREIVAELDLSIENLRDKL